MSAGPPVKNLLFSKMSSGRSSSRSQSIDAVMRIYLSYSDTVKTCCCHKLIYFDYYFVFPQVYSLFFVCILMVLLSFCILRTSYHLQHLFLLPSAPWIQLQVLQQVQQVLQVQVLPVENIIHWPRIHFSIHLWGAFKCWCYTKKNDSAWVWSPNWMFACSGTVYCLIVVACWC